MRKKSVETLKAANLGHGLQPGAAFRSLTEEHRGPGGGAGLSDEGWERASWAGKMVEKLQPER